MDAHRSGETPPHALVVGGTGMLSGVSARLLREGWSTSVVARRARGFARLAGDTADAPGALHCIEVDYRDTDAFVRTIDDAVAHAGQISLAVVWVHSVAPDAPAVLAAALVQRGNHCRFLHVLGSAAADPSATDDGRRAAFERHAGLRYEEVILGFVHDGTRGRWLTNGEIAAGVNEAVDAGRPRTIVGTVTPWSNRP